MNQTINRKISPAIKNIDKIDFEWAINNNNLFEIYHDVDLFKLELVLMNTGTYQTFDKFTRQFTFDMLLSGTNNLDSFQISETINLFGAYIYINQNYYSSSIIIYGQLNNAKDLIGFVLNTIKDCNFDEKELNILKEKRKSELKINLEKATFLSNREFSKLIYGESHSNSYFIDNQMIDSINRNNLSEFKSTIFENIFGIYTGPKSNNIYEALEKNNIKLKPNTFHFEDEFVPNISNNTSIIKKEGSTQSSIRMGLIVPKRHHKDSIKIQLLNTVFGGYFGSRLMQNIREEKGLTYGINSSIIYYQNYGLLKISSECNQDNTKLVLEEIKKEMVLLKEILINFEEIETVKNFLKGNILRSMDGSFNISEKVKMYLESHISQSYINEIILEINKITSEDLIIIANNYFNENALVTSISGDL